MARWLITGCSTGFGREIARAALEAGHSVVVTARRAEAVQDLADEFGDRAVAVALDVTDAGQIAAAVSAASTSWSTTPVTATYRRWKRARTPRFESCSTSTTSVRST
jgi:NADP-dependent 3-hydroxy acid dehydrogenase YdfG